MPVVLGGWESATSGQGGAEVAEKEGSGDERRRHRRLVGPVARIGIGGHVCKAVNWSLGGILIEGRDSCRLTTGALVDVVGLGLDAENLAEVRIRGRVQRVEPTTGRVAISFLDIDDRAYAVLLHMVG